MNADFKDAHERHWEDAEHLHEKELLANADYLYGLSAECGLKAIMQKCGMKLDGKGSPENKEDRKHINELIPRYNGYRDKFTTFDFEQLPPNLFKDWHVDHRYANRSNFTAQTVQTTYGDAFKIYELVRRAIINGLMK
ncbi:MAG: hypothetical protein QM537_04035 [Candidatus Symbiobacter sp.]|nr:hypothetical protein [Candidatus Symbiobacter sp.]